jgi:rod shape-determining protein MreD
MAERGRAEAIGRTAVTLILIVVVQGILAYRLGVFAYFDLPLIYGVYYGFSLSRPLPAIFVGSGLGLLQDSLSGAALGTNGFSKTLICFLAATTGLKFKVDQGITRIAALFLFTCADALVVTILALILGAPVAAPFGEGPWDVLLSGAFNTLLGLMVFGYHDRFENAR